MPVPYPGGCQCGDVRCEVVEEPAGYNPAIAPNDFSFDKLRMRS